MATRSAAILSRKICAIRFAAEHTYVLIISYFLTIFDQLYNPFPRLIDRSNVAARSMNKLRRINRLDAMNVDECMIDRSSAVYRYDELSQFSRLSPISTSIHLPSRADIDERHALFQARRARFSSSLANFLHLQVSSTLGVQRFDTFYLHSSDFSRDTIL